MTSTTDLGNYDSDGGALYSLDGAQAERFDDFLLALPAGDQRVYLDGIDRGDQEREEAFQRGVLLAATRHELGVDEYIDLAEQYGRHRSKAKTDAHLAFAETGERPRARQLEIDYWRGAHHAAKVIRERLLDIYQNTETDELLKRYIAQLPMMIPDKWRCPRFEKVNENLLAKIHNEAAAKMTPTKQVDGPPDLFHVPGFIDDVMKLTLSSAPYPNKTLAFAGAIALLSVLTARRISFEGLGPNIYCMALARSGSGKDWPRKINAQLLADAGMVSRLAGSFGSGEAVEDAVYLSPELLAQIDELDSLIRTIGNSKEPRFETMRALLLTLYTSSGSIHVCRKLAKEESRRTIDRPALSIYGTCTPGAFHQSISEEMMKAGFVARMLVLDAGSRGTGQRPLPVVIPDSIREAMAYWRDFGSDDKANNLACINPTPMELPIEPDASDALDQLRRMTDEHYRRAEESGSDGVCALWARVYEQSVKLAMLYAVSGSHENPVITSDGVRWAGRLVTSRCQRLIGALEQSMASSDFERLLNRVKQKLASSKDGMRHSELLKYARVPSREFSAVISTLQERDEITVVAEERATKHAVRYRLK